MLWNIRLIPQWGPLFPVDHDVLSQEQGQDLLRSRDVQGVVWKDVFFPLEDLILTSHHCKNRPNLGAYSTRSSGMLLKNKFQLDDGKFAEMKGVGTKIGVVSSAFQLGIGAKVENLQELCRDPSKSVTGSNILGALHELLFESLWWVPRFKPYYWNPATTHPQKVMNLLNFHEFPLCTVVQLSNSTASYLFLNEVYWSLYELCL